MNLLSKSMSNHSAAFSRGRNRREGAKPFAMLDPLVEDVLHVRVARVGEDRAVAQRAGAELAAAVKERHDRSFADRLRDLACVVRRSARLTHSDASGRDT